MGVVEEITDELRDRMSRSPHMVDTLAKLTRLLEITQRDRALTAVRSCSDMTRANERDKTYSDVINVVSTLIPDERKDYFDAARRGHEQL